MFSVDGDDSNVEGDDGDDGNGDDNDVHRRHGYATPEAAPNTCHPLQLYFILFLYAPTRFFLSRCTHIFQVFHLKFWTRHTVYPHHDNHEIGQEKIVEELISNLLPTCL